jgi:hypothetical protein
LALPAKGGVAIVARAQLMASDGAELSQRPVLDSAFVTAHLPGCTDARAEAIAAVYDGRSPVTMEQLASQPLGALRDRTGKPLRDLVGNPVIYIPPQEPGVNTLRDFVVRARFGHFNGLNGSCQTEVRVR